ERVDNRRDRWQVPTFLAEALAELPPDFTSLLVSDTGQCYRRALRTLADNETRLWEKVSQVTGRKFRSGRRPLPPAEVGTRPLFPNVSAVTSTSESMVWTSRFSLPVMAAAELETWIRKE